MNDNNPFFSVIIPTRNRPEILKDALNSVLQQDEPSIEIIVVNDGSDQEYSPLYTMLCNRKNITLINLEQSINGHGPSYALNMAVNIAQGQYIAFLDDDDQWITNSHLSNARKTLSNTTADLYFTLQEAYKNNELVDKNLWLAPLFKKAPPFEMNIKTLVQCGGFSHRNNLIISRFLYNTIKGHDEDLRYEEDREFYFRAIEQAKKIIFSPEYISRHNIPIPKNINLSTSLSDIKKLRSQLYLFDSLITQSNNKSIIEYIILQKNYTLKKIAEMFYQEKKYKKSLHYARQVILINFNFKWLFFVFLVRIKSCMTL